MMKRQYYTNEDITQLDPCIRMIAILEKEIFGTECNEHNCCSEVLNAGMMIKFRIVDFSTKDGSERAV